MVLLGSRIVVSTSGRNLSMSQPTGPGGGLCACEPLRAIAPTVTIKMKISAKGMQQPITAAVWCCFLSRLPYSLPSGVWIAPQRVQAAALSATDRLHT